LVFGGAQMNGDYDVDNFGYNIKVNYRYLFNNRRVSLNVGAGFLELDNKNEVSKSYNTTFDLNVEYIILHYENVTPYIYGGIGSISDQSFENIHPKVQLGIGVEYLPVDFLGLTFSGEQNITFTDELDGLVQGKRDDYFWRFGLGVNFYFGK